VSIEVLKAKGQNDNFSICGALLKKGLQEVGNLLMTWMGILNVDPQSPVGAFE
jgi:hypothetical protein